MSDGSTLVLAENTAIVTGASSGLGARFARVLHGAGATVVLVARRGERLEALADDLGKDRAIPIVCDLADDDQRVALVEKVTRDVGPVDVLVNNAGSGVAKPSEQETLTAFRESLEVNVVAVFHLSQLVGAGMLQRGRGSIINIASMFGLVASAPIPHTAYCTSKGAIVNMTRALGAEWAPRGVRVNAIAPGWFESEMTQFMWDDEKSLSYVARNTPAGRHANLEEFDGALLLLAGPGGSFINGQTIVVDGGWTAR